MPRFVPSKSEVEIKWRGFSSNVYILLYYVALSTEMNVTAGDCRRYVSFCEYHIHSIYSDSKNTQTPSVIDHNN